MRRLIIRFAIGVFTFFIGVTVELIFTNDRQSTDSPQLEAVKPLASNIGESPELFDIPLPPPDFIFDYDPKEFNPRGDYYILGSKPKGFGEFYVLELAVSEIEGRVAGSVMIGTYGDQTPNYYYTVSGLVTKKNLNFVATPLFEEDFEYRFDGNFLRAGVLAEAGKNSAVLKGKLSKFKAGVKIAESEVRFRVEYLGC